MKNSSTFHLSSCALLLGLLSGCSYIFGPPSEQEQGNDSPAVFHKIEHKGETLGSIAKWYTGDAANWEKLQEANPGIEPTKMQLEQVVKIPGFLALHSTPYAPGGETEPDSLMTKLSHPVDTTVAQANIDRCVCPVTDAVKTDAKKEPEDAKKEAAKPQALEKPENLGETTAKHVKAKPEKEKKKKAKVNKEKSKAEAKPAVEAEETPAEEEEKPEHMLVKAAKTNGGEVRTAAQRVRLSPEMEEARRRRELHEKTRDELLREMLAEQQRALGGY